VRGIVLAGGSGTRLWPITKGTSKQLIPVYDKPMVYYPLSTLMAARIREVLIITAPEYRDAFQALLGDGSELGMTIDYAVQARPDGLAQAFVIGEEFLGGEAAALVLGDNIFHGTGLGTSLTRHTEVDGAVIFAHHVADPENYGVVEFDDSGRVLSIVEKPSRPRSNWVVPGLYFYDHQVVEIAKSIKKSDRGEYEISDVNQTYLDLGKLRVQRLDRGTAWLDTGSFEAMMAAGEYVRVIEHRQGLKVGCIEEVAWRNGWIDETQLAALARQYAKSGYGQYLTDLIAFGPHPSPEWH
jgi:glucose-1-phosphate thymidylyltransferase